MNRYINDDGTVRCPICNVIRYNMPLMLSHLGFWHDLTPPNVRRAEAVIETGLPAEIITRRDGRAQQLYVDVPLPGF